MIYNETQDPNVTSLDTTKQDLISEIKEIIKEYGTFSCGEIYADHSPTIPTKGNLVHLVEYFEDDKVNVEVYDTEIDDSIDAYNLTYEELDIETLKYILELTQRYQEQQEED